jgi:cytochrome c556
MRRLERLRDDRLPRNMDVRAEEERRAERIAKIALAMAQAADRIPDAASDVSLDPAQQAEFARLANALRQEAQKLAEAAPGLSSAEMQAQADAIDATCDQCHQQFRIQRDRRDAE